MDFPREATSTYPCKAQAMKRFLIIVEKTATGFSAYSPDLPDCVSTGRSQEEI